VFNYSAAQEGHAMLEARKVSIWRDRYAISADGRPVAVWDGSVWTAGGRFELDGRRYEVRGNLWGSRYGMIGQDGARIAVANRVGRKRWTVEAAGRTYDFQRASLWRGEQELRCDGRRLGSIRRTSIWRGDAVADLPGVPLPVQIFVLAVVLTMWESSSGGGAGAIAGGAVASAG
jgi:hypothetical protein